MRVFGDGDVEAHGLIGLGHEHGGVFSRGRQGEPLRVVPGVEFDAVERVACACGQVERDGFESRQRLFRVTFGLTGADNEEMPAVGGNREIIGIESG